MDKAIYNYAEPIIGKLFASVNKFNLSLTETGELDKKLGYVQSKVDDDFEHIPVESLILLINEKEKALKKYSANNHLQIGYKKNIMRAIRHLYIASQCNTDDKRRIELTHAELRLLMAIECQIDVISTNAEYCKTFTDWESVKLLYNYSIDAPAIMLFPAALRRVASVINQSKSLTNLMKCILTNNEQLSYIDCIICKLMIIDTEINEYYKLIKLIILAAVGLVCMKPIIDDTNKCDERRCK